MSNPHRSFLCDVLKEAALAARAGQRPLAVFDLDSTLFDLRERISEIVLDFARDPENARRHPVACRALLDFELKRKDWGLHGPLARLGLRESEHPEFFRELHDHWELRFFSGDYLRCDQPLPGAVEFVQELESAGVGVLYLTGRDVPRMWDGTVTTLKAWGFPLDETRARLILKPDASWDDAVFKADVLERERERHGPIWFFENEAINLREAARRCPDVRLVFIDTNHSGRAEPWDELAKIPHFETDLEEFRAFWRRLD